MRLTTKSLLKLCVRRLIRARFPRSEAIQECRPIVKKCSRRGRAGKQCVVHETEDA